MRSLLIIQARMGSSRLPGKVLLPLGESNVLDYVVTRSRLVNSIIDVVVATSSLGQDDPIEEWCNQFGVTCYRGSEDDVLSRYIEASASFHPDYVIRVTGDCPFVDYEFANEVVRAMQESPSDIVIFKEQFQLPRGLNVEMMSYSALLRINDLGHETRHREHVTYFAYEFPEYFTRTIIDVPNRLKYPQLRLTLDTPEDYTLCKAIADAFPASVEVPSSEVVSFLLNNPEIVALNAYIEQKPVV